jgi:hypothetical protein
MRKVCLCLLALSMMSFVLPRTVAGSAFVQGAGPSPRFVQRNGEVFAIGAVSGTVSGPTGTIGTSFLLPVSFPVHVGDGVTTRAEGGRIHPGVRMAPGRGARVVLAQASTCGVFHLDLGAVDLNLLGVGVTTTSVTIDINGDTAGPLGNLEFPTVRCGVPGDAGSDGSRSGGAEGRACRPPDGSRRVAADWFALRTDERASSEVPVCYVHAWRCGVEAILCEGKSQTGKQGRCRPQCCTSPTRCNPSCRGRQTIFRDGRHAWLNLSGRLAHGHTISEAQSELNGIRACRSANRQSGVIERNEVTRVRCGAASSEEENGV